MTGHQKPVYLSAKQQIEEPCGINPVLVLEEKSIKLPVKCQQRFMPRILWWTTDLINAKFNSNTIHINMGQHVLEIQ